MKVMKHVPNALSISRIFLAVALLFLTRDPWIFGAVYLIIGLTDVFDGKIARRFHVESNLGSKLDAVGDSMLFGMAAICLFFVADMDFGGVRGVAKCLVTVSIGVVYKLANVAVTHARFHEWNMMHTLFNRLVFVGLYFTVPVFIKLGEINYWVVVGITAAMCLACLEETVTLLTLDDYDVNNNGILGEKIVRRAKRSHSDAA